VLPPFTAKVFALSRSENGFLSIITLTFSLVGAGAPAPCRSGAPRAGFLLLHFSKKHFQLSITEASSLLKKMRFFKMVTHENIFSSREDFFSSHDDNPSSREKKISSREDFFSSREDFFSSRVTGLNSRMFFFSFTKRVL
jgi:hypothetical protein